MQYFSDNIQYYFCDFTLLNDYTDEGWCNFGDIRLSDGLIEQEGRVEICVDNVWGVICDDGFDKTDAHVACQQLGHPELGRFLIMKAIE